MDIQQAFLSRVIHDQAIRFAVKEHVNPDFFTDDRYRRVYEYLLSHWHRFGTPPDLAVVKQAFPTMDWPLQDQSMDYFIDQLRLRRKRALATAMLQKSATLLTAPEPEAVREVIEVLQLGLMQVHIETAPALDQDLAEDDPEFAALLENRMEDPGYLRGISTGFKGLDYVTGGFQPEHFIVMIGLPKSMKSSTLLYMAMKCHAQGKVPLFVGFEMSNTEQQDRLISMGAGVGLTKILTGTLVVREYNAIRKFLRSLQGMRPFILSGDISATMTVSGVQAKMTEYLPDVVFIDGAYMMMSEQSKIEQGSPQALTDIARSLKRLAQNMKIPIVVTTQASATRAKGGQLNAYSAMYTQAWQQSADILLGVERIEQSADDDSEVPVKLRVLNSRSGPRADTYVVWEWSKGSVVEMDPALFSKRGGTDDDDD